MTPMVTAAEALLFTPFTGGLLLVIVYAVAYVARRDREEESDAGRLPEDELLRREDEWFDHPAYRADIARTRRDLTKRHMTEEAWKRATGQDIA